jgi:hypothetical protein
MARKEAKGMLNLTRKQGVIWFSTVVIGGSAAFFAITEINQPKTFEECVLKNVRGEETAEAVRAIQAACMQLKLATDQSEQVCRDLNRSEVGRLQTDLSARRDYAGDIYIDLNVYNGNKLFGIEKINLLVSSDNYSAPREYELTSYINKASPLSSGVYSAKVGSAPKGNVSWKVLSAQTCQSNQKN